VQGSDQTDPESLQVVGMKMMNGLITETLTALRDQENVGQEFW